MVKKQKSRRIKSDSKNGCKVVIKRRKDGTIYREFSEDCTSEERETLDKQIDLEE